jgi:hypothetical protein
MTVVAAFGQLAAYLQCAGTACHGAMGLRPSSWPNALTCRQSCLGVALARDDDGSVACCFSKAGYVAGVAGEDAVAGRGEEYYGRVDRV